MLQLPMQTHGELAVMRDHADPSRAYAVRLRPRLSTGASGRPALHLTHWTSTQADEHGEHEVGGHLFLEIDVEPTAAERAAAGLGNVTVETMPWLEARAVLELQGAEPVTSEVSVVAGGRAAFALRLTPQQVNLLAPQLTGEQVAPLQITWVGMVRARLPAVEVTAVVDSQRLRRSTTRGFTTITREQVSTHATVVITGAADPELEAALHDWALDELARRAVAGEDLELHTSAADVGAWPIRLPATLDLEGIRGQSVVTTLALPPDELGEPPPVRVEARGPVGTTIERVDVELRPEGGEVHPVVLNGEEAIAVALPRGPYEIRHRVVTDGMARPWSSWRSAGAVRQQVIPVVAPPPRAIEVMLAGLDLRDRWASVRVELYAGSQSTVIELTEDLRSATWTLPPSVQGAEVQARTTFVSRQGMRIEPDGGPVVVEHDQLVLHDPFGSHRLSVTLVPTGVGWDGLALAMIDVRHEDGSYTHEQAVELRALSDLVKVALPSRPQAGKRYAWRIHASYEDGRFAQTDWQDSERTVQLVSLPGAEG